MQNVNNCSLAFIEVFINAKKRKGVITLKNTFLKEEYQTEFSKRFSEKYEKWKRSGDGERKNDIIFADEVFNYERDHGTGSKKLGKGCNAKSIYDYRKGNSMPGNKSRMIALAAVLGCDVSELLPSTIADKHRFLPGYINQVGSELEKYAQSIGLSLHFVAALKEIVPDYSNVFPLFLPVHESSDAFDLSNAYTRYKESDACNDFEISKKSGNDIFQFEYDGKTITISKSDLDYLKTLQDEIVSFVLYQFSRREKEMETEIDTLNAHINELRKGGFVGLPLPYSELSKYIRYLHEKD